MDKHDIADNWPKENPPTLPTTEPAETHVTTGKSQTLGEKNKVISLHGNSAADGASNLSTSQLIPMDYSAPAAEMLVPIDLPLSLLTPVKHTSLHESDSDEPQLPDSTVGDDPELEIDEKSDNRGYCKKRGLHLQSDNDVNVRKIMRVEERSQEYASSSSQGHSDPAFQTASAKPLSYYAPTTESLAQREMALNSQADEDDEDQIKKKTPMKLASFIINQYAQIPGNLPLSKYPSEANINLAGMHGVKTLEPLHFKHLFLGYFGKNGENDTRYFCRCLMKCETLDELIRHCSEMHGEPNYTGIYDYYPL